jgi:hypothetical protein
MALESTTGTKPTGWHHPTERRRVRAPAAEHAARVLGETRPEEFNSNSRSKTMGTYLRTTDEAAIVRIPDGFGGLRSGLGRALAGAVDWGVAGRP